MKNTQNRSLSIDLGGGEWGRVTPLNPPLSSVQTYINFYSPYIYLSILSPVHKKNVFEISCGCYNRNQVLLDMRTTKMDLTHCLPEMEEFIRKTFRALTINVMFGYWVTSVGFIDRKTSLGAVQKALYIDLGHLRR